MAKEVTLALLGHLRSSRFVINGFVQLGGESGRKYSLFATEDLKKIEAEATGKGYTLVGLLHTHPDSANPSTQDRLAWLTLMFEFNRPLIYFILQLEPLRLAAYSIPLNLFMLLKESIRPIQYQIEDTPT
jgi:proteasome lid subunit RPN8/RPN11